MELAEFLDVFSTKFPASCSKHQYIFHKVHNLLAKLLSFTGFAKIDFMVTKDILNITI